MSYRIPFSLLAGRFDLAFVVIYLLPLLIFAFSYKHAFGGAGERHSESGARATVDPDLSPACEIAVAGCLCRRDRGNSLYRWFLACDIGIGGSGVRIAASIWTLTVAAYGLFWLGLATLINSRGWSAATNAITLAGVWLALVAIVPSVINVAISTIHPLPSRIGLVEAAREAQNRALIRISNSIGPIDMDQRARSSLIQIMEAEAQVQPLLRRFDEQLEKQQEQVRRWRFLSPAIMTHLALTGIAGTDGARYRHFVDATEQFRREWRKFLSPIYSRRFTAADVDRVPRFSFEETVSPQHSMETPLVLLPVYALNTLWALRLAQRMS